MRVATGTVYGQGRGPTLDNLTAFHRRQLAIRLAKVATELRQAPWDARIPEAPGIPEREELEAVSVQLEEIGERLKKSARRASRDGYTKRPKRPETEPERILRLRRNEEEAEKERTKAAKRKARRARG